MSIIIVHMIEAGTLVKGGCLNSNIDDPGTQYLCVNDLQYMKYPITIYREIGYLGHGEHLVNGLNVANKIFLKIITSSIKSA